MIKHIELIQGYYKFLSMGKFFEMLSTNNDLSQYVAPLKISTGENTFFGISDKSIKPILKAMSENPQQKNIFGYLVEVSARRGVFSATKESIENDKEFHDFVKNLLGTQFFPFSHIITLLRNFLSHHMDSSFKLKTEDYQKQKEFLLEKNITTMHFIFKYSEYIKERKGNKDYGLDIKINIKNLYDGINVYNIVSRHQLYMLSELCFNISEIYRVKQKGLNKKNKTKINNIKKIKR